MRTFVVGALVLTFFHAPLQCSRDPDPNQRREDTAGDALWGLAQDQRARHEDAAARETLRYLVDRYPSSRYAEAARAELARGQQAGEQDGGE